MRRLPVLLVVFLLPALAFGQAVEVFDPAEPTDPKADNPRGTPFRPTAVLWDNGPLINCAGCGVGGADESVLQNVSLGMTILGYGHQLSAGNRIADDFDVVDPAGWDIDSITFFAYQTNGGPPSTISGVNLRIWDGPPGGGGTVIFGDTTTNLLSTTDWTNIYRVTETTTGTATNRPIMFSTLEFVPPLQLAAGTYWLDWQTDGSVAFSGPWAPPITINGQTATGDGLQSLDNGVTFAPAIDVGGQGFPFIIEGEVTGGVPTTPAWGLALLALALLGAGYYALWRRRHA